MRSLLRSSAVVTAVALAVGLAPASAVVLVPQDPLTPGAPKRVCAWPINYPAAANYSWPDTDAAYFVQSVLLSEGDEVVITGRSPKARYWSIQTYDYADREVIDSVNDEQVKLTGKGSAATWRVTVSTQPSRPGDQRLQGGDPYVVGSPFDIAKDGSRLTIIIYRVYRSQTQTESGGPLPSVTLRHADGTVQRLKPCASSQVGAPANPMVLDRQPGVPADFTRADGGRFYPSFDTSYLVAERPYDPDRVLVVTGRAPRVPSDMRYWSLCQNVNRSPLPVVDCASDRDIALTDGRFTIAVVTPEQVPIAQRRDYPGVTFVDWGVRDGTGAYENALLILRNILPRPAFAHSVSRVPLGQPATTTMGDYAPVIAQVTVSGLRSD